MKISKKELESLPCIHQGINCSIYRIDINEYKTPVILKILTKNNPSSREISRYVNEFEITKNIDLPGIRTAYQLGKVQGKPFIILENIDGTTVKEALVKQQKKLEDKLTLMIAITKALMAIHQLNIIHRNISSNNIIVDAKKQKATIIDFSIARKIDSKKTHVIRPKEPEGTLHYISPEQTGRLDRFVDWRTDFYSLGVVFFEILTGKLPFETNAISELVHFHIAKHPDPVSKINPAIPKTISDIVIKLMSKNPENRYQSAHGLLSDLENCLIQFHNTNKIKAFNLGRKDFSGKFQLPQKLYGRKQEIQTLIKTYNRVNKGANEVILVSGQPGTGKSSLIRGLKKYIVKKQGYFISGSYDQYQGNTPYLAFIQALTDMVNQILSESTQQLAWWKDNILKAIGSNGNLLVELIPELELIIGPQLPVRDLNPTKTQYRFNNVFQAFIRVIARKEHPLVIFIDNLQWVDIVSLNFLRSFIRSSDNKYLLFIGAYRDNEVAADHQLISMVEEIKQTNLILSTIHLENLDINAVNFLISDSLQCGPDYSQLLSQMIYKKTSGNPFFISRFLMLLYEEGILNFQFDKRKWTWDIDKIHGMNITDDMAAFFAQKIEKLPKNTKQSLISAACIGNIFSLRMLADVMEQPLTEISESLGKAIDDGLIQALDDNYKMILKVEEEHHTDIEIKFEFSHKKIRNVASSMISKKEFRLINLVVGRLKLKDTKKQELEKNIYEITDHLNEGFRHIKDEEEQFRLAGLNLIAGRNAKNATAYKSAIWYLSMGMGLLKPDKWERCYDLTLSLYLEAIEAEYVCSNFERAEFLSGKILQHAKALTEKIKVYELRILFYTAQNRNIKAINYGLEALKILGVTLPAVSERTKTAIEKFYVELSEKIEKVKDFAKLPLMQVDKWLAAMRILMNLIVPAHKARLKLVPLIVFKMVSISFRYGNSSIAPFAYCCYASILIETFGEVEKGYRLGQKAVRMLQKLEVTEVKAKVIFVFNTFIRHWKKPVTESIDGLHKAYQYGIETGDLEYAYYGILNHCGYMFSTEKTLEDIRDILVEHLEVTERLRLRFQCDFGKIWNQMILYFMGSSSDSSQLKDKSTDVSKMLPVWKEQNNGILVFCAYYTQIISQYIFGRYSEVIESARMAEKYLEGAKAFIFHPQLYFYYALALLAEYPRVNAYTKKGYLEKIEEIQKKFKEWSGHSRINFQPKYDLIKAERIRISKDPLKAMELYSRALIGFQRNKSLHEIALTYEREAELYLELGREEFAQICISHAYNSYREWGATHKVEDLEKRYKFLSPLKTPVSIDTETIIKTSQTLSQEIQLDRLLDKMMHIVIENAGAQKGILIQNKDNKLIIQAKGEIEQNQVETMQEIPIEDSVEIPLSIVNYTARTKTLVVLNNAFQDSKYNTDIYILKYQPKSIICLPIVHQNKLFGLLYLENNLTTNAFTSDRVELLKALSIQLAISLEKAGLYTHLEEKIKEQKLVEEALEESKERFRDLVESTSDWVWEIDRNGFYTYVNPNVSQLLGYNVNEVIGKTPFDFMPPEEAKKNATTFRTIVEAQRPVVNLENINIHKDGHVVYLETSGVPFFSPKGELMGYRGIDRDITERKQFEQTLRENEKKFRSMLTNIPGAVYRCRVDANWTMHLISNVIEEISGYPASDFIQNAVRTFSSIIHADDRKMVERVIHDALEQKSPFIIEYRIINADGIIHWVYERGQGFFGNEGKALWLDGAIFDITARKQVEDELKKYHENLEELIKERTIELEIEKNKVQKYLDVASVILIALNADQQITLINQKGCTVLGYSQEEIIGKNWYNYFVPENIRSVALQEFKDIIAGKAEYEEYSEKPIITKNGDERLLAWHNTLLKDDSGEIIGILSSGEDITDRKHTEKQIEKLNQDLQNRAIALEVANKELEAFSYSVSHDLRAPLRSINGFSHILLNEFSDILDPRGQNYLTKVLKGAQRMSQLIDDLLKLSRVTRSEMKIRKVDLSIVAKEIVNEFKLSEPERKIEFIVEDKIIVYADAHLLRIVMENLISNAWKFTTKQPKACIELGKYQQENKTVYFVRDNGAGFNMKYANKLFGSFQRLHPENEFPGTGIGLATVQRIIHRHGGKVWAEGEVDKGAAFYFTIP